MADAPESPEPAAQRPEPRAAQDGRSAPARSDSRLSIPLAVLAVCATIALLHFAAPVLLPLVLAMFLFYALDPFVDRLERWRIPRLLASILIVVTLLGGIAAGGVFLMPQFDAVVTQIPEGAARLRDTFRRQRTDRTETAIERVQAAAKAIDSAAAEAAEPPPSPPGITRVEVHQPFRFSDWLWTGSVGALVLAGQAVTVLFLTIFLLNEGDSFKRKIVRHTPTLGEKRLTVQILNDISRQIMRFIWVQAATSAVVAVATGLALWWLGVQQPAVWGLFAGVMNLVPYFGPLVVTVVLTAIGYLQLGTIPAAVGVGAISLVITSLEGMLLTPMMLSKAASLNHVAIFVAIAFWSWLWGVPGMLLAVPLLMAVKVVCDRVEGLDAIASILGNGSSPREA